MNKIFELNDKDFVDFLIEADRTQLELALVAAYNIIQNDK